MNKLLAYAGFGEYQLSISNVVPVSFIGSVDVNAVIQANEARKELVEQRVQQQLLGAEVVLQAVQNVIGKLAAPRVAANASAMAPGAATVPGA